MVLRIIVVEDQPLFRELLVASLHRREDGDCRIEVVGAYADAETAERAAPALRPAAALLDVELGAGPNGLDLGRSLRQHHPAIGLVLLSHYRTPDILSALGPDELPGWAYLLKQSVSNLDTLVRTLRNVCEGLMVVDPTLVELLRPRPHTDVARLTPRQYTILALIAEGYSNHAIAERLILAEKSVENQITAIYQHLGIMRDGRVHPRVAATRLFLDAARVRQPQTRGQA